QFITQIADYSICNGDNMNLAVLIANNSTVPGATFEWIATFNNNINSLGLSSTGGLGTIDQVLNLLDPTQPSSLTIQVRPVLGTCKGNFQDIIITVNTKPEIQRVNIAPATICNNGSTVLTIVASPVGTVYDWVVSNVNGVVLSNGSTSGSSTSNVITMNLELIDEEIAGRLTFTITPRNGNCIGLPFTTGIINVNPIPGAPFFSPLPPICSGGTTAGLLVNPSFPVLAGTEIVWEVVQEVNVTGASNGFGIAPAPILQTLTNTTNNQGYVIYSVKSRLNGCESNAVNITVFVNPKPKPDLTDGHICVDPAGNTFQSYFLSTQLSNANFRYRWFKLNTVTNLYEEIFGETNSTYEVTTEGTYKVEVIDVTYTTNCIETDIAVVGEEIPATGFTYVVTDAFTDNATITILVNPVGTGNLIYSLDGGAWQSSNVFTGVEAGEHEVLILDEEGCTNLSDKIFVIDYPKYFTPNGDGIHDTWNVVGLNQADAKLYIFDRYGKLIKQLVPVDGSPGWDGTYNGQLAPSTDYWFTIEFSENNQQKQFKSHFSLKR
uniref:T9SS type B sorting domain-containing protein n=1 Tax=Flavobacterium facile TaxID=2893174 RepID=UPI002E788137